MTSKRPLKRKAPTVGELVADLRRRYRSGKKLAKDFPVTDEGRSTPRTLKRAKYAARGEKEFKKRAAKERVAQAELFSRRRFAVLYTEQDLDRLCKRRTRKGKPLSWAIVKGLLRVESAKGREKLERTVAEKGWTVDDLRAELRLRTKTPHVAGRSVRTPKSLGAGLVAIAKEANYLVNLLEAYMTAEDSVLSKAKTPRSKKERAKRIAASTLAEDAIRGAQKELLKARNKLEQLKADLG